jgi:D-tyrosyl-tRNA(Tyr) deacylase
MIAVIQRVSRAQVSVEGKTVSKIGTGFLVLLGVGKEDSAGDAEYLARRTAELRIFPDNEHNMNRSLAEVGGAALVVSQFTLLADTRKGRRPSFVDAAPPETADALYLLYCDELTKRGVPTERGVFGAMMAVELVNDGPVTIILRSKERA